MIRETIPERFLRMNSSAANTFEIIMRLIDDDLKIVLANGTYAGHINILRPMTDAFIYELWKAVRLANQAEDELKAEGIDIDTYVERLNPLDTIRNVTDHGRDKTKPRKATIHRHGDDNLAVDETSLIIRGAAQVFRGTSNLYDLYVVAAEMEDSIVSRQNRTVPRYRPRP